MTRTRKRSVHQLHGSRAAETIRIARHDILGGLDLMATFAAVAGVPLPTKDREGAPMMFDSYDMTPALLKTGKSARDSWYYFTEDELSPGAIRLGKDLMKTYVKYPPRKAQSETYTGPITISKYQKFKWVREQLEKEGVSLPLPTGN